MDCLWHLISEPARPYSCGSAALAALVEELNNYALLQELLVTLSYCEHPGTMVRQFSCNTTVRQFFCRSVKFTVGLFCYTTACSLLKFS